MRRMLSRRWVVAILLVIALAVAWAAAKAFVERSKLEREIRELEATVGQQRREMGEYQKLLDKIRDFTYIEREARLKFGLKKPGEKVVIVPKSVLDATAGAAEKNIQELGNPQRWWKYFFGRNSGD